MRSEAVTVEREDCRDLVCARRGRAIWTLSWTFLAARRVRSFVLSVCGVDCGGVRRLPPGLLTRSRIGSG